MNKAKSLLVGLLGIVFAGTATAANVGLEAGPNAITAIQCPQLANDIRLVLTNNVIGGIDCDTDATVIGLSLCHSTGLTTERTVAGQAKVGVGTAAECVTGLTENTNGTCDGTVTGAAYPTATTAQGTVASRYPGVTCAEADALAEAAVAVSEAVGP